MNTTPLKIAVATLLVAFSFSIAAFAEVHYLPQTEESILNAYGTLTSLVNDPHSDSLHGSWTAADLYTYTTMTNGKGDSKYGSAASRAVVDYFVQGFKTKNVTFSGNAFRSATKGDPLQYGAVKEIAARNLTTTNGASSSVNWLTLPGANNKGEYYNGYYAFQYAFDLGTVISEASELDNMKLLIDLTVAADDHLEAIFLNGKSLKEYYPEYGAQNWNDLDFVKAALDISEWVADGKITDGENKLTFVLHNDGHNGQAAGFSNGTNATGIGIDGFIAISANERFAPNNPGTPVSTPEPATMLILGLGAMGLAISRRRFA